MKNLCGNCKFWNHSATDRYLSEPWEEGVAFAECRRFPPTSGSQLDVTIEFFGRFPVTLSNEWCGEWKAIAKEDGKE